MFKFKNLYWIFPFIGGVLIILSQIFPAAIDMSNADNQLWICGIIETNPIKFIDNSYILIVSMVCFAFILFFGVSMIITALKVKRGEIYMEKVHIAWFLQGFIIIFISIAWMLMLHILILRADFFLEAKGGEIKAFLEYKRFWEYNYPGFGLIGTFIGAAFSISGAFLKKHFCNHI